EAMVARQRQVVYPPERAAVLQVEDGPADQGGQPHPGVRLRAPLARMLLPIGVRAHLVRGGSSHLGVGRVLLRWAIQGRVGVVARRLIGIGRVGDVLLIVGDLAMWPDRWGGLPLVFQGRRACARRLKRRRLRIWGLV